MATTFRIKRIATQGVENDSVVEVNIITQNENGPCPLLVLANILILRGDLKIHQTSITLNELIGLLGDFILRSSPESASPSTAEPPTSETTDYQQNLNSVLQIMPTLQFGLDVNVLFKDFNGFELTPQLILFDLFRVQLVHGWLIDPDTHEYDVMVNKCGSYNKAVEMVIEGETTAEESTATVTVATKLGDLDTGQPSELVLLTPASPVKSNPRSEKLVESLVIRTFLDTNASQLTEYGLAVLRDSLKQGGTYAFFRNNHFAVLYKHKNGQLYTLCTDQGFVEIQDVVWETLSNPKGNEKFTGGLFEDLDQGISPIRGAFDSTTTADTEADTSVERLDKDLALALKLQDEEESNHADFLKEQNRKREAQELKAARSSQSLEQSKKTKKGNDCVIM